MRWLLVVTLALGVAGLGAWRLDVASGDGATLSLEDVPASVAARGAAFDVEIRVAGVANLGTYEWQLAFDSNVVSFVSRSDGGFLGSTGRAVSCQPPVLPPNENLQPGNVRSGCNTIGSAPPGPSGSGLLSSVRFQPEAGGAPNIRFVCAGLGDPLAEDIPISNVSPCVSAVTPTPGPGDTPVSTATPGGPPTATPAPQGTPAPTATPSSPVATPTPLPPGMEAVPLVAGCNPVASTYGDGAPVQTVAGAVGPAGNLVSLWAFETGTWRAFSPQYPQVSDLTGVDFLDVIFACVRAPGAFARPLA